MQAYYCRTSLIPAHSLCDRFLDKDLPGDSRVKAFLYKFATGSDFKSIIRGFTTAIVDDYLMPFHTSNTHPPTVVNHFKNTSLLKVAREKEMKIANTIIRQSLSRQDVVPCPPWLLPQTVMDPTSTTAYFRKFNPSFQLRWLPPVSKPLTQ